LKALRVFRVSKVKWASKVSKVLMDSRVFKVHKVLMVSKVFKVFKVN
jgi:hypothetical protein